MTEPARPAPVSAAPGAPREVTVLAATREAPDIVTLRLSHTDPAARAAYRFQPGQFNMLYLYGVGEVPISIVSDRDDPHLIDHTIRAVGRVTRALARLRPGDRLGLRGPFGRGWPLDDARGRDVLVLTGGLGCAPSVGVIRHILRRRDQYGRLFILQGVKHANDLIWRDQYAAWAREPGVQVLLAADVVTPEWTGQHGLVTELLDQIALDTGRTVAMMCGPEPMMVAAAARLRALGLPAEAIWLSMERNMQCAVGLCGHCQFGPLFVCRDGPVFNLPQVSPWLGQRGF